MTIRDMRDALANATGRYLQARITLNGREVVNIDADGKLTLAPPKKKTSPKKGKKVKAD